MAEQKRQVSVKMESAPRTISPVPDISRYIYTLGLSSFKDLK